MRSILKISFHTEGKRFRLEKVALIKISFIRLNHALPNVINEDRILKRNQIGLNTEGNANQRHLRKFSGMLGTNEYYNSKI